jgi:hypothetical protein
LLGRLGTAGLRHRLLEKRLGRGLEAPSRAFRGWYLVGNDVLALLESLGLHAIVPELGRELLHPTCLLVLQRLRVLSQPPEKAAGMVE